MDTNYLEFINSYNSYIKETKYTLLSHFKLSNEQCDIFLTDNEIELKTAWDDSKTVREALNSIMIEQKSDNTLKIAVNNIEKGIIDDIIKNLSFIYKKRKERYLRVYKVVGSMGDNITLRVELNNKDIVKIEHEGDTLKVFINNTLVYYMDGISKEKLSNKISHEYKKHLLSSGFIIKDMNNPI